MLRGKKKARKPEQIQDILRPARGKEKQFEDAMAGALESLVQRRKEEEEFRRRLLGALQRLEAIKGWRR